MDVINSLNKLFGKTILHVPINESLPRIVNSWAIYPDGIRITMKTDDFMELFNVRKFDYVMQDIITFKLKQNIEENSFIIKYYGTNQTIYYNNSEDWSILYSFIKKMEQ